MASNWLWPEDDATWSSLCFGFAACSHGSSLHQWALASRFHFVSISDIMAVSNESYTTLSEDRTSILINHFLSREYPVEDTGTDTFQLEV